MSTRLEERSTVSTCVSGPTRAMTEAFLGGSGFPFSHALTRFFSGSSRTMEWNACGAPEEKSASEERRDRTLLNSMTVSGSRGWFNVSDKWSWFLGFGLGSCLENCGFCLLKRKFLDAQRGEEEESVQSRSPVVDDGAWGKLVEVKEMMKPAVTMRKIKRKKF